MRVLRQFNPRRTLFGRIFVWFWLAVIIMLVSVFSLARYFSQTWQVSALSDGQLARVQVLFDNVQALSNRGLDLQRALRRVSARGRWQLMAVDMQNKDILLGFPPPLINHKELSQKEFRQKGIDQKEKFIALAESSTPVLVRIHNMEFVGPIALTVGDLEYQVFVGQLLPREQRPTFIVGTSLFAILLLGSLACVAIAWTIAKPIKRLSLLSNQFASGQEQAPDAQLLARKDELGQLHNDIYSMASNLAKSLAQQKALMANISHELRTPLTRLQLSVAMLAPNNDNQNKYAERIEKEIKVMDSLIGQALQLAKLEDNQAAWMQKQVLSLPPVISPLLADLQFEAKATHIDFTAAPCPDVCAEINKTSLVSAIENVTRNAFKYASTKVSLGFEIVQYSQEKKGQEKKGQEEQGQIQQAQEEQGQIQQARAAQGKAAPYLKIVIEDDGPGLPEQQCEQIFEPFYRAHSGEQYTGTGLGLSIAKAAIELHHGNVRASKAVLGGLQVVLTLPLCKGTSSH